METRWLYVTSEEFPVLREASARTVVIPMGCVEKHGLHLPLGQDIIQASHIAYRASQIEPFCVFPDFIFGDVSENSPHMPQGSITFPMDMEVRTLEILCDQIARNGYRKIVIYNGHGGNRSWLAAFLRKLQNVCHDFVAMTVMINLPAPHGMAELLLEKGSGCIPELMPEDETLLLKYHRDNMKTGHACFGETAFMMGISPQHVHLDRLGVEDGHSTGLADQYRQMGVDIRDGGWSFNYPNAFEGDDPVGCNERIGQAAIRLEAERLARVVKFIKEDTNLIRWHNQMWDSNLEA